MPFRLVPALLLFFAAALASAAPSGGVLGDWQTPGGSVVRIEHCGAKVCLQVKKLPPGVPTTDIHNPDPALHDRALCGLRIGSDFTLADADHASGGTLYDPKTGKTYRGAMTAQGERLQLRGYVGIPLFGKSQTWTRIRNPVQMCSASP